MNLGFGEIALIVFVALLLFGPKKLPELGKAAGKTLREFKDATRGIMDDDKQPEKTDKLEKKDV
ncbi:twin-arginine translocase TatA/TatE family subunit [Priestia koreensis]|uniref:Sec-independent protein translocase protein TatA n=1 Tax=Priestia koreensis TaxID=284581 RepID=A0A0M0LH44_9BACI|nr:twin-arginine translocase TatA/TatE family subunit [Priestia koreensis]KOO50405.1 preprotein translocase subunit TatA [Priestia koreensis]MCM3002975.1 twin-arginine translocase TatA/TatE family subunit [Priestia koreensis]UNL85778.1 twin-arginine translocase TatA/TatE family subunit [Priestia koreensis]